MPSLSTKERKTKSRVTIKEFNSKLSSLVTIQNKMEFDEPIENLETLLTKNNVEEETELIEATKER